MVDFVELLVTAIKNICRHNFISREQAEHFEYQKENLIENVAFFIGEPMKNLEAVEASAFLQEEPARKKRKEAPKSGPSGSDSEEGAGDVNVPHANTNIKFVHLLFLFAA